MRCTPLLYVATDVDIPLQIAAGSQFELTDIADLEVTLTYKNDPEITKTWTYSDGQIAIDSNDDIFLKIGKTDVTGPGLYWISIRLTDQAGKVRGITPCPDKLRFHA